MIERQTLHSALVPGPVPCALLRAPGDAPAPLVLALHGGRSSCAELETLAPLIASAWDRGLPPMSFVMASTDPMGFYLDHPDGAAQWERLLVDALLPWAHAQVAPTKVAVTGMSMGGMGALKLAFRRPHAFAAVAALCPMIEPGVRADQAPPRSRLHHHVGGPAVLFGPERDPALFEANNPASLALAHADALRASGLKIRLDAGDHDALHAHDGAEHLHRVLWDLDVPHEYHLVYGADHVGRSIVPRLERAWRWLGRVLTEPEVLEPDVEALRAELAPLRARALAEDPTTARRYGVLPRSGVCAGR